MALILAVHALRSYLKVTGEHELHSLPNKKVSSAKDHGKNYIKVRLPLVHHLLCNHLLIKLMLISLIFLFPESKILQSVKRFWRYPEQEFSFIKRNVSIPWGDASTSGG